MTTNTDIAQVMTLINKSANRIGLRAEKLETRLDNADYGYAVIRPVTTMIVVDVYEQGGGEPESKSFYSLLGALRFAMRLGYTIHRYSREVK